MNQNHMPCTDRHIIILSGTDAEIFLQNIITTDLSQLQVGQIWPGALLSPQGKILFSFLISRHADHFKLDINASYSEAFLKRLQLYRLHAKVDLQCLSDQIVWTFWAQELAQKNPNIVQDMRFKTTPVYHHYSCDLPLTSDQDNRAQWLSLCIENGIAEMGREYNTQELFPHDINFDCLGGINFKKGCYVGQEVVSRMQHRSTPRRRLLIARTKNSFSCGKADITVDNKIIGTLYAHLPQSACAILRIDKASEALTQQKPIIAQEMELTFSLPATACFSFPITADQ